jgi:bacteriocin-like protein
MDNSKTELEKKDHRVEGSHDNLKTELSDAELSTVSGGRGHLLSACVSGTHIKTGKITM